MNDEKKTRPGTSPKAKDAGGSRSEKDVGQALRSVYTSAVAEDIPPELLDLLGKLN